MLSARSITVLCAVLCGALSVLTPADALA